MSAPNQRHAAESEGLAALGEAVKDELRRDVDLAKEKARELAARGKEAVHDMGERAGERVKEHPLASIAIAGGVGLLVGYLIGRRR